MDPNPGCAWTMRRGGGFPFRGIIRCAWLICIRENESAPRTHIYQGFSSKYILKSLTWTQPLSVVPLGESWLPTCMRSEGGIGNLTRCYTKISVRHTVQAHKNFKSIRPFYPLDWWMTFKLMILEDIFFLVVNPTVSPIIMNQWHLEYSFLCPIRIDHRRFHIVEVVRVLDPTSHKPSVQIMLMLTWKVLIYYTLTKIISSKYPTFCNIK